MKTNKALVVIDLQNDITKNYKKIIAQVNNAIDRASERNIHIVYIKHYNLSEKTRTFKPDTKGAELVPELKVVSKNIFDKFKASALTNEAFADFISRNDIGEFYIVGADATACVKSTCYNLVKSGYKVHVISDCVTSYNLKKMDEMFAYYADKGCEVQPLHQIRFSYPDRLLRFMLAYARIRVKSAYHRIFTDQYFLCFFALSSLYNI